MTTRMATGARAARKVKLLRTRTKHVKVMPLMTQESTDQKLKNGSRIEHKANNDGATRDKTNSQLDPCKRRSVEVMVKRRAAVEAVAVAEAREIIDLDND